MSQHKPMRFFAQALLLLACLPPLSAAQADAERDEEAGSVAVLSAAESTAPKEAESLNEVLAASPGEAGADSLQPEQAAASLALPDFELPGPRISLDECLRRALKDSPALAALQQEVWAAQARCLQGGLKPNPEIDAEISEFLGTAETRFFRSAVTGVGLSQLIERGNKRCARMAVAAREGSLAELEIERARLDIMLAVSSAYYTVLAAQERLKVSAQLESLAKQVRDVVALKVEAGKAARLELSRVEIDSARAGIAKEQAEQELARACKSLSLLWGETEASFAAVEGELALPDAPPDAGELRGLIESSPDISRWDEEQKLRRARRELAYAEGIPDYTLSGGLERFEETDSFGFRLGISMPLPIRDRKQGSVVEAQRYMDQAGDLRQAEVRSAQQSLYEVSDAMRSAYQRARALETEVLPPAMETLDLTSYGYRYGKFGVLDVLDSERTLVEARSEYVDALAEYYLLSAKLERLIAPASGAWNAGPSSTNDHDTTDRDAAPAAGGTQ